MGEKTMVIDMQHHYIPSEALQLVGKTSEYDFTISLKRYTKANEIITNIDKHLEWMDAAGIDMAVLSTASFTANGDEFCKVCNDGYAKIVKQYPERFKGMIHVYPFDGGAKIKDEIQRGIEELGLWGITVVTSYQNMFIDSKFMDPIFEMAIKHDTPIYVHPTIRINLWGGERYDLYTKLSREYDIAKSFMELVYGVLPRFPDLKIIFSHFGGGLPSLKGRLLAWHQSENVQLPEEDRRNGLAVLQAEELGLVDDFESMLDNMLFDSAGFGGWFPVIKSAFESLGADHICFGSDYPYELKRPQYVKRIIDGIWGFDFPQVEKENFFSGNLLKIF